MISVIDKFQFLTLIVFLVVFIGRSVLLYVRYRINPLVLGVGKTGFRRVIELSFFVGFFLWIVEILIQVFHWEWHIFGDAFASTIVDLFFAKIAGMIIIVLGFVLFVLALVAFGRSWRVGIDKATPGNLVTHGVFRFSRNPIFLFIDLYFFGTFLINGTLFFLLIAIAVILGMHYQILQEEDFLMQNYGQSYLVYYKKVGRYFSWQRSES